MLECGDCGATNADDSKFCAQCGISLVTYEPREGLPCNACGAINADDSKFCAQCGTTLGPDELPETFDFSHLPTPPPVPSGARRGKLIDRFANVGVLKGRTRAEIESVVGPPYSVTLVPPDGWLVKWSQTRMTWHSFADTFHIELLFDSNGICGGVAKEYRRAL